MLPFEGACLIHSRRNSPFFFCFRLIKGTSKARYTEPEVYLAELNLSIVFASN